jgi:hypothetical protein
MDLILSPDRENGVYVRPAIEGILHPNPNLSLNYCTDHMHKGIYFREVADGLYSQEIAGFWGYLFQIVYQVLIYIILFY